MRFPRFYRVEYVLDLLRAVNAGSNDLLTIDETLRDRKAQLEHTKYIAFGKGKRVSMSSKRPSELTRDCISACLKMELISTNLKEKKSFKMTDLGKQLLSKAKTDEMQLDSSFINEYLVLYLRTYSDSLLFLKTLLDSPEHELNIVDTRNKGHASASQFSKILGVRIDALSLKNLIYTLDQGQLVNFRLVRDNQSNIQSYMTCKMFKGDYSKKPDGINNDDDLIIIENYQNDKYTFVINDSKQDNFEISTWEEYMNLTKNYEDIPVYYWDLRSAVCYHLRISDAKFDKHLIEMYRNGKKFRMGWSSGSVPSSVTNADTMKSIPPKIDNVNHVVYLSFDKRREK